MLLDRVLPLTLPNEHIVFLLRRHWFVFAKKVVGYIFLFAWPILARYIILTFFSQVVETIFSGGLLEALVRLGVSLYYLAIWLFFWSAWADYYLDVWVVTNERIVSFEQRGLFNREVSELRLSRVQNVSAKVQGLINTMLDFGEVGIETAGEQSEMLFSFHQIPHPYQISEKIIHLTDDWRHTHQQV
jgi:uncharacterized membrane protein YdbT with pleckstrin-like domain